jgi:hypothetical protein
VEVRFKAYRSAQGSAPIESFSYETQSGVRWVSVEGLERRRPDLDHYLVSVREGERASR